jgi:hypothetical protein
VPALRSATIWLASLSLTLWVAALGISKLSNNDIWLHLKTGQLILTSGGVPHTDTYSFTALGNEYVAHEWLAAVFYHLVHSAAGIEGLILARTALVGLTAALLVMAARAAGAGLALALPSIGLGLYVAASRFYVRPHLFSYVFTALYLWAFFTYRRRGRDIRWLAALLPVQILWANTHGGGVLGLLLLGIFAAGEGLAALRERLAAQRPAAASSLPAAPPKPWALAGVTLAAAAASLLNPYGYRVLLLPFRLAGMRLFMEEVYEWQPPYHGSYSLSVMLPAFVLLVAGFLAAAFLRARNGKRALTGALLGSLGLVLGILLLLRVLGEPSWSAGRVAALLYSFPILMGLFSVVNFRTVEITRALLFITFLLMALRHNRAVADAALVTSILLASAGSTLLARGRPMPAADREGERSAGGLAVATVILLFGAGWVAAWGYPYRFDGTVREGGFGIGRKMPLCAVDYIQRTGITGNAFVSYTYGAMLTHRMHPAVKVNMDSRNDVYGEDLYRGYVSALSTPRAMDRYLQGEKIDFFLLSYDDTVPEVGDYLLRTGDWAPVYFDHASFILVRRRAGVADLIRDQEYRLLRPAALGSTRLTRANAPLALVEADRAIQQCGESFFGPFYRTKALMALGRYADALETSREAVEIDPANSTAWADMGLAYAALDDRSRAIQMYQRALQADPDNQVARENLRTLLAK